MVINTFFERIPEMPKQKTHKGLSKRIKITAGGKVRHKHASSGHLMNGKNAKRRRHVSGSSIMTGTTAKTVKSLLGK